MNNAVIWGSYAPLVAVAILPAILNNWRPLEIVALVAVLGVAGAVGAWAWVWHMVRLRQLDLTALSTDEQAARLLGESLGRCGPFLGDAAVKEVWDVFATVPSESKRALTLAVTGFLAATDVDGTSEFSNKLLMIAHSFRDPSETALAPVNDEQVARAFGEAVGRCENVLDAAGTKELWDVFAVLPADAKRGFTNALTGFLSTAALEYGDALDEKILALARSFREHSCAPSPCDAAHTSPILVT